MSQPGLEAAKADEAKWWMMRSARAGVFPDVEASGEESELPAPSPLTRAEWGARLGGTGLGDSGEEREERREYVEGPMVKNKVDDQSGSES
jgi:hypothetical protein